MATSLLPFAEHFWSKVRKTKTCWLWIGSISEYGHGRVEFEGRTTGAHRVAWILTYGPILPGFVVAHQCQERACVRPLHLRLCTRAENTADGNRRKRGEGRLHEWRQPRLSLVERYGLAQEGPTKICSGCKQSWPMTMFHRSQERPDGRDSRCRLCRRIYEKQWELSGRKPIIPFDEEAFAQRVWVLIQRCGHEDPCPYCCWPWIGRTNRSGYGVIFKHKNSIATRIVYELWNHRKIKEGMLICHHCDNPICVNPLHLWEGTSYDNWHDCHKKGRRKPIRMPRGAEASGAKLVPQDVTMIRLLRKQGFTYTLLESIFHIKGHALHCIIHYKTWIDVVLKGHEKPLQ